MPKISVVIPCYNASEFISRCVKSLEEQDFKDFKVIFVDDCSEDDTVNKIEDIQKNSPLNIVLLKNEVNRGPAFSRNAGIQYSNTEYITFCDCDDWYEPDFLSTMFNMISQNNVGISLCGYNVVDERGNSQKRPIIENDAIMSGREALKLDSDSLCMLMVRTDIMKETLLPDIRNGEDVAVVPMLILKSENCMATSKCMYNYFRRSDSASQKPTMKVVDSLIASFNYTKSVFPKQFTTELEYLGIKNMLYSTIISLFSFSYDTAKANKIIESFEAEHSDWINNPYFEYLSLYKKVVLKLLKKRWYFAIKSIAIIRNILVK